MPGYTIMKTIYLRGLLWLYLLGFFYTVLSLEPGFLDFDNLPDTNFSCVGKVIGGYYADLETNCQMFHVCTIGQLDEPMDIRFLCLNGTVFDQETRVCERIDEVDCSKSEQFYSLNLELYGNTQPSVLEEGPETDPPIIIKASTTTTTTTTTPRPTTRKTTRAYYTTSAPTVTTVTKVISSHHFPISGQSDIRFNPEEINISLNPGAPPNIRSKPVSFQQQVFNNDHSNNKKVVVTTHTTYGSPEQDIMRVVPNTQRPQVSSTQKIIAQPPATPAVINYGLSYHQTENNKQEYQTELPQHNYQYHHASFRHGQFRNQFKTTTYRTEHLTTRKLQFNPHREPTTFRTPYVSSVKTPTYQTYRTEKPQRLQLPLPLLPTLPPLTFSSPAPFSLGHHIETKRYTSDHQPPPRIIISASASVSDQSGRRLNYSLGTIGVTPLLEEPPKTYDEYKDHDVVLDPFYHDVPKIKPKRRKRQVQHTDIIRNEQEAVDVLKFLFDWYKDHEKTSTVKVPIDAEDITEINQQLAPIIEAPTSLDSQNKTDESDINFRKSALFQKQNKFNIVGDVLSVTEKEVTTTTTTTRPTPVTPKLDTEDYVDDNYEAVAQQEKKDITTEEEKETTTVQEVVTKLAPTTTTIAPTTTSKLMGRLRSRARAHYRRVMNESRQRHSAAANLKRKGRGRTTTEKLETLFVAQTETTLENQSNESVTEKLPTTTTSVKEEETTVVEIKEVDLTTIIPNIDNKDVDHNIEINSEESALVIGQNKEATLKEESQIVEVSETEKGESLQGRRRNSLFNDNKEEKKVELENDKEEIEHDIEKTTAAEEQKEVSDKETTTPKEGSQLVFEAGKENVAQLEKESEIVNTKKEVQENLNETVSSTDESIKISTATEQQEFEQVSSIDGFKETVTEVDYHKETTTPKEFSSTEKRKIRMRGRGRSRFANNIETEDKSTTSTTPKVEVITEHIEDPEVDKTETMLETLTHPTIDNENIQTDLLTEGKLLSVITSEVEFVTVTNADSIREGTTEELETSTSFGLNLDKINEESVLTKPSEENGEASTTEPVDVTTEPVSPLEFHKAYLHENEKTTFATTDIGSTASVVETETETSTSTTSSSTTQSHDLDSNSEILQLLTTEPTDSNISGSTPTSLPEITVTNLTPAQTSTTETFSIPRGRSSGRRIRPSRPRSQSYRQPNPRHRFSTELFTTRPTRRKPVEEEIIDTITRQLTTTENLTRDGTDSTSPKIITKSEYSEDVPATDAPLFKSANPTQAESAKESLHTTPLSMVYKMSVRKGKLKSYIFNCFGKTINKFYSDPRDCRLFHYCTTGYTKNQLLDMKFVCDLGTYFDDEKLICTKVKPERCL